LLKTAERGSFSYILKASTAAVWSKIQVSGSAFFFSLVF